MIHKSKDLSSNLSSQELLSELETHVQHRLNGRVAEFRLSMQLNGLVLKGHARSYYAKQLAQQAIMEAVHLNIAANEIEVM